MDCSNPDNSNREAIVDKLHGVLASLRRERDELHRKKALAKERLHLFQEEKEAMGKTFALAQGKLEALQQSSNDKALQEFNHLEHEVSRLTKEVDFQHLELIAKRHKVQDMIKTQQEVEMRQSTTLASLRGKERNRRQNIKSKSEAKLRDMKKKLSFEIEHEIDIAVFWNKKIPRWMKLSRQAMAEEANEVHEENECLSRVLKGYKEKLDSTQG